MSIADTEETASTTGNVTQEIRVQFGPKGHQVLTVEVASMVLTLWRDRAAAEFGRYLAEVMTGAAPAARRGRQAAHS